MRADKESTGKLYPVENVTCNSNLKKTSKNLLTSLILTRQIGLKIGFELKPDPILDSFAKLLNGKTL